MDITLFYIFLPLIALLYAAVGHGGASGYLALMGIFAFVPDEMRPTALVLNLFVAAIAFIHFARAGHFKFRTFLVFALASIPMAYYGGKLNIDAHIYKIILGVFLLLSVSKMTGLLDFILKKDDYEGQSKVANLPLGLGVGAGIGLFSGLIGIGGGIILSPVILILRWGTAKEAAAVSALFIWVNSLAGLIGQYSTDKLILHENLWLMIILVVIGGFVGGLIGTKKLDNKKLRYLLSILLLAAAIKLIFGL
ncbi:MAG: putative membrane protein YfcA [Arenicella sp.]|jgi:uncharacterized membrane protein YfcA